MLALAHCHIHFLNGNPYMGLKPIWCHLALKGTCISLFISLLALLTQTQPLVQHIHKNDCNSVTIFYKEVGDGRKGEYQIKK